MVLELERPPGFTFLPGQSIRIMLDGLERDYSLCSGIREETLRLLLGLRGPGSMPARLLGLHAGSPLSFEGPHGFFLYEESALPAVFAATGVGVAPVLSMVRSGLRGFALLYGVREPAELHFREELASAADCVVPCISRGTARGVFSGRVTAWTVAHLPPGRYSFYLSGRREMVRDMTLLVDERFAGSLLHTEIFF